MLFLSKLEIFLMPFSERHEDAHEQMDRALKQALFEVVERQLTQMSVRQPKTKEAYEQGLVYAVNAALDAKQMVGQRRQRLLSWLMGQARQQEKWLPPGKIFGPKMLEKMVEDSARHEAAFGPGDED